jgi:hypothetical protein
MRIYWFEMFVTEPSEYVIKVFRECGLAVDYNETISPEGHARGFIENGFGGIIMDCEIWRQKKSHNIFEKTGERVKTCIEISSGFGNLKKIMDIIKENFNVISNGYENRISRM